MHSLTMRLGLLMFVAYGLACLLSLLHKGFIYW